MGTFHSFGIVRAIIRMKIEQDQTPNGGLRVVSLLIPSGVSALRVLFALCLVVYFVDAPAEIFFTALIGVPIVMSMDALDGILARYFRSQTIFGSFIDIAADRLVEFIFLLHLLNIGLIPSWFVFIFYGRIILADFCRMRAFRAEQMSAEGIFLPHSVRSLVMSRISRSGYGALKGTLFSVLLLASYRGLQSPGLLENMLMLATLAVSLIRATPILFAYLPFRRISPPQPGWLESTRETQTTRIAYGVQLLSDIGILVFLLGR
jgi:phosphatidylglycerophosphate synthase